MIEKSSGPPSFYRLRDLSEAGRERVDSLPATAGPWGSEAQHGGPPAALLGRSIERLGLGMIGRFTMELLGPVPVGPLEVGARVVRPGRSVQLAEAEVYDASRGRVVARAAAWLRAPTTGPASRRRRPATPRPTASPENDRPTGVPATSTPSSGVGSPEVSTSRVRAWSGCVRRPWWRGEQTSPLQRLLACVDSASGASAMLDVRAWGFLNTELSVHVLREPVGEWVCLDAETALGPGSMGFATSRVYDEWGLVARSAQALLVTRR